MKRLLISLFLVTSGIGMNAQNVGIGTTSPHAPLQFNSVVGNRKIVLFEGTDNEHQYYGFGVNPNILRYQTDQTSSDHVFYAAASATNSNELMRIKGNGNVGIGIAPANRLDIHHGIARTGNHPTDRPLYVTGDIGELSNGFEFRHSNGTQGIGLGFNSIYAAGSNASQGLRVIAKGPNGALHFYTNGVERLRVAETGDVGIGTASPNAPLQFSNTTGNRKVVLYDDFNNDHQYFGLGINPNMLRYQTDGPSSDHAFFSATSSSASAELVRIKGNGNVGIGTSTPHAPLQFSNDINSRKVVLYENGNNDHQFFGFGINPAQLRYQTDSPIADHVFYAATSSSTSNELMRIKGNGNIGLGTSTPHAPLQFSNVQNSRKVVLYENSNNDHQFLGFGNSPFQLRYQTDSPITDHVFYAATSSSNSNELMRIKGNGDVDISGSLSIGIHIVESAQYTLLPQSWVIMACDCPNGESVLSGGYWGSNIDALLVGTNRPLDSNTWQVGIFSDYVFEETDLKVYAVCARLSN